MQLSQSATYKTGEASWSEAELRVLEAGLLKYPTDKNSSITRYIKIASTLPLKNIRDVAHKVRTQQLDNGTGSKKRSRSDPMKKASNLRTTRPATRLPAEDQFKINSVLQENILLINQFRENLLLGPQSNDNITLMTQFKGNIDNILQLLAVLEVQMPPFPVEINTSLLSGGTTL